MEINIYLILLKNLIKMSKIMKNILLFFTFLTYINSECGSTDEVKKKKECNNRVLSSSEKSGGGYKCCYVNSKIKAGGETTELKYCYSISEDNYNNIKDFVKNIKDMKGVKKYSIECNANYIKFFNIILIILFLIL